MGKVVKAVVGIGIAVAAVALAPIVAPSIAFALGVSSTAAAAIGGMVLGGIAALAQSALSPKKPSTTQSMQDRLSGNVATDAPRRFVFGRTAAAQDIRFKEPWGSKSDKISYVIALASHRVAAINSISLGGVTSWNGGITGKYAGGILALTPITEGNSGNVHVVGSGNYWTATSPFSFTGCSYFSLTLDLAASKVFTEGPPNNFLAVVDGCPVYDPRRDGSRLGSGSHRPDDQSTWQFSVSGTDIGRNPALCLLTYLIGWRINGILAWGRGVPIEAIDLASFITYANLCEEQVAAHGGGTTQRYTCDYIGSTNDSHETTADNIVGCMGAAKLLDCGGYYQLVGGYNDLLSPTLTLTTDDLVGTSPCEYRPAKPTREFFNSVTGRFADPSDGYNLKTWGFVDIDPLVDGIPRPLTLDFPGVSRPETCQRIAKQFVLREKFSGTFTGYFGPRAFAAPVGSLVRLTHPEFGFFNKLFRVTSRAEDHDLVFAMTLVEESPEIYAWDTNETKVLPSNVITTDYDPIAVEDVFGLSATARSVTGAENLVTAYIDVVWNPPTSGRVARFLYQTKLASESKWSDTKYAPPAGSPVTFAAAANGLGVNIRAAFHMQNGALKPTSQWATYTLGSTPVTNINKWSDIYGGGRPEDGANVTETHTSLNTANVGTRSALQVNQAIDSAYAAITDEQSVRASAVSALANRTTTLEVRAPVGNWIDNSDFLTTSAPWSFYYGLNGGTPNAGIDVAGDGWRLAGEHNLSAYTTAGATGGEWGWMQTVGSVVPGRSYGLAALGASHRASSQRLLMRFVDAAGNLVADYQDFTDAPPTGGTAITSHRQFWVTGVAPAGAATVQAWMLCSRVIPGQADAYQWWHRPQFIQLASASQTELPIYTPGNAKQAAKNLSASLTTAQGAIATAQGKLSAYWTTTAVAGSGRAQLSIHADANGGGGVDIVGDTRIAGNLLVDGDITSSKFNTSTMVKLASGAWTGPYTASPGTVATLINSGMGTVGSYGPYAGNFLLSYSINLQTNANTTEYLTYAGRPFYRSYPSDGGVSVLIVGPSGENYGQWVQSNPGGSKTLYMANVNAPFNASLRVQVYNGSYDSGIIDQGDYFTQQLSPTYTVYSAEAYAKWTII